MRHVQGIELTDAIARAHSYSAFPHGGRRCTPGRSLLIAGSTIALWGVLFLGINAL